MLAYRLLRWPRIIQFGSMHHVFWLKYNTTLFSLSDHYILRREWRVIVDQVQTNYQGRAMVL